jgi:hypothetical protein
MDGTGKRGQCRHAMGSFFADADAWDSAPFSPAPPPARWLLLHPRRRHINHHDEFVTNDGTRYLALGRGNKKKMTNIFVP